MNKKLNETVSLKSKDFLGYIMSDLVPLVSNDLKIGFQEADDIVRGTEFYQVLLNECILRDDYNSDSLLLILRKELVRSGKCPIRNDDGEVEDFSDFAKTMRHEIVFNCAMYKKLEPNLTQVSLLVEGIENFTIDKNTVQTLKDISVILNKYIDHLEPKLVGKSEMERANSLNDIWWKFNADIQVLLAHCKKYGKRSVDLTAQEIDLYISKKRF